MSEENLSQEFRWRNIEETRNHFIKEISQRELMSKKYNLYYTLPLQILASPVTGCISISTFAFSLGFPIAITSSATGFKICPITAEIKKYQETEKEAW